jgi:phosphoribosyl 1,2-cyclic phosphate phosphodiesterase
MQALRYQVSHVDGLLLTHAHYDHVAGIDELRVMNFRQKKAFPCLLSQETYDALRAQHDYLFEEPNPDYYKTAHLNCLILPKSEGQIDFLEIPVSYVSYRQAGMQVNGFRIGNFAYVSDIRDYEETIFDSLLGVETLVLSALKKEPSNVHFGLDEAVAFARKVKAAQTWLTHLSHALDHTTVNRRLPPEVQLAFDGLSFPFKVTTHA